MSDELKPWLQEGAPSGVSKLLESAASDGPSAAALGKLSAKLAAAGLFAPGGGGGGGGGGHGGDGGASHAASHASTAKATGAAAKAASVAKPVALGAKMLLIGSATVAAVGGGAFQAGRVVERRAQEERVAQVAKAPVVVATPTPPPPPPPVDVQEPEPAPEPVPEPVLPPVKQVVKPKVVEAVSPEQEAELLTRAMGASQQAQWADALAAAEQHARRFPNGSLAQEREMIAIESLLRLGRRGEAERRAEKFRKAWPTSTHLVRLNTMLKE